MARTLSMFTDETDAGQDLHLDERGNLALAEGLEDVRQRVIERLQFYSGSWFLDVQNGIPYSTEVFTRPSDAGIASSLLTDQISAIEGVERVLNVEATIDPVDRRLTYRATVSTPYGNTEVSNG